VDSVSKSVSGTSAQTTLAVSDGATGASMAHRVIELTGTITGNYSYCIPLDAQQLYVIKNSTSGAYTVEFTYTSGSGRLVLLGLLQIKEQNYFMQKQMMELTLTL
jgi:hypothetical protein